MSPAARTLSITKIASLSDDAAIQMFEDIRWCDTKGQPVCPHCQSITVYRHAKRRIFSCRNCKKQFSVTSGTAFHARKLPIKTILIAIAYFINGVDGFSALHLTREIGVSYKSAFVLFHKLREALAVEMQGVELSGEVEIDGVYVGGFIKPANNAENRVDRRLAKNQNGKRRTVIVMRQRGGRTLTKVERFEHLGIGAIEATVAPGSTIYVDEARSWDKLEYYGFDIKRVNHEECYSTETGINTNSAESYNSRLRRAEAGVYHHISGPYLQAYSDEIAWREDTRRFGNKVLFFLMALPVTRPGISGFRGYWQRHRRGRSPPGKAAPA